MESTRNRSGPQRLDRGTLRPSRTRVELYQQALDTLKAAQDAHRRACAGKEYISNEFLRDMRYGIRDFAKDARKSIDRDMWRFFISGTPLGSLMDAEERKRFEDDLRKTPPEVSPDTVFATMSRLAGEAETIFRRGLANAFAHFCRDYKSHDGFKIGARFVVPMLISGSAPFYSISHWREDAVRDIDRCMHVMDGKPAPEYQQGVLAAIRAVLRSHESEVTTDYFRVRLFRGNGNAHFYPLRPDR